jgi:hypothetical protein
VLADSQDNVFKRVQELKDQIDSEKNSKKDLESQHKIKLAEKDTIIIHLKNQVIFSKICYLSTLKNIILFKNK